MRFAFHCLLLFIFVITFFALPLGRAYAFYDPLSVPNNKFGIHILSPDELPVAAKLVNTNGGDWGYAVIVIQSNDRDLTKWQQFMNQARQDHIIPIIRLATKTNASGYWEKPEPTDAANWANFLSQLHWPTNNHYVIIYNEPNHATEWGNQLDPAGFANEMAKTITEIKAKDPNIFALNPGFDAAAPNVPNQLMDESEFLAQMHDAVPDIFKTIDGWASHSYPQPAFSGDPLNTGRNTITTYRWEMQWLFDHFQTKTLPIFITETGWASNIDDSTVRQLGEDQIAAYYQIAFTKVWTDPNLVTVAPFTLSYSQKPFDQFSWIKKPIDQVAHVLGVATNLVNDGAILSKQFTLVAALKKFPGMPIQKTQANVLIWRIPTVVAPNTLVPVHVELNNNGETEWFRANKPMTLHIENNGHTDAIIITNNNLIVPGLTYNLDLQILAPQDDGVYTGSMRVAIGHDQVAELPFRITVGTGMNTPSFPNAVKSFFSSLVQVITLPPLIG